jgi:hypothetical protein
VRKCHDGAWNTLAKTTATHTEAQPADAPQHSGINQPSHQSDRGRHRIVSSSQLLRSLRARRPPKGRQPRSRQVVVVIVAAVAGTEDSIAGQMRYAADCPHVWRTVTRAHDGNSASCQKEGPLKRVSHLRRLRRPRRRHRSHLRKRLHLNVQTFLVIRKAGPQQERARAIAAQKRAPRQLRLAAHARAPLGTMRSAADALRRAPLRLAPGPVSGTCWA